MQTKSCRYCHKNLPLKEFGAKADNPDGLSNQCRNCKSASNKAYHRKNPGKIRDKNKDRLRQNYFRRSQEIMESIGGQCRLCGGIYKWLYFDLDHIDPSLKTKAPSQMIQHASDETWAKELTNLRAICARCHRKVTVERRGGNRSENRQWIYDVKTAAGCLDCGWNEWPEALEFDHIPSRGPKLFNIGCSANKPKAVLEAEMAKCDIVCIHCHRDRTYGPGSPEEPPGTIT